MDTEILKTAGQIAGIGGLALGVFLLLFRDIIRKNIFPRLPPAEAYRLLRLITGAVWSVAIVGIGAWVYVETRGAGSGDSVGVGAIIKDDARIEGSEFNIQGRSAEDPGGAER